MKTQIILVDDNIIFRQGLKLILENTGKFDIIAEVADEVQLHNELSHLQSGLILINLRVSQNQVISITKKLNSDFHHIPFMVLADGASEFYILECIINGAKGIIWKDDSPDQLINAIHKVINGKSHLNIPDKLMEQKKLVKENEFARYYKIQSGKNGYSSLSNRELEVVKLFAEGKSYKIIADQLHISPRTVESHKNNILEKLNLSSLVELVKFAIRHRIIES